MMVSASAGVVGGVSSSTVGTGGGVGGVGVPGCTTVVGTLGSDGLDTGGEVKPIIGLDVLLSASDDTGEDVKPSIGLDVLPSFDSFTDEAGGDVIPSIGLDVLPSDETGGGVAPNIGLEVPVLTTGDSVVPPSASVAAATVGLVVSINCSNAGLATGLNVGHGIVGSNVPPSITGDEVGFDVNSNPTMVGAGVVGTGGVVGEAV